MASRLCQLYLAVAQVLRRLHIAMIGPPTLAVLIVWRVTSLILVDARPTQTRVARLLPGRCHDALNRLLRTMPFSTRALSARLVGFARRLGQEGYLVLDDVIVEKAYAKRLPWAGWTYSFAKKRKVYGLHMMALLRRSGDGHWGTAVGFRLWRPKRTSVVHDYGTNLSWPPRW